MTIKGRLFRSFLSLLQLQPAFPLEFRDFIQCGKTKSGGPTKWWKKFDDLVDAVQIDGQKCYNNIALCVLTHADAR